MFKRTVVPLIVFGFGGCASVVIPPEHLEREQASMRAAEELGANNVPNAKLHLQLAQDETASAKKMAADGDDRATMMLARAESDAELAVEMAREVSIHTQAVAAADELRAIRSRAAPASPPPAGAP